MIAPGEALVESFGRGQPGTSSDAALAAAIRSISRRLGLTEVASASS